MKQYVQTIPGVKKSLGAPIKFPLSLQHSWRASPLADRPFHLRASRLILIPGTFDVSGGSHPRFRRVGPPERTGATRAAGNVLGPRNTYTD